MDYGKIHMSRVVARTVASVVATGAVCVAMAAKAAAQPPPPPDQAGAPPYPQPAPEQPPYQQPQDQQAAGQPPGATPPVHLEAAPPPVQRHVGFYARTYLGLGGVSVASERDDLTMAGSGGVFGLALGYSVAPRLSIYGELFVNAANEPTIKMGGTEVPNDNTNVGAVGFGVGVAYYFASNIYLSGTLGATSLSIQNDGTEVGESKAGVGVSAMVGKEWWVSENWGLGIAVQLLVASMKDKGSDPARFGVGALGVVFSATYN